MSKEMFFFFFKTRAEKSTMWHIDVHSIVWTFIGNSKLTNQIARLVAIVVKKIFSQVHRGYTQHVTFWEPDVKLK